jgi:hypothetical protein
MYIVFADEFYKPPGGNEAATVATLDQAFAHTNTDCGGRHLRFVRRRLDRPAQVRSGRCVASSQRWLLRVKWWPSRNC